MKRQKYLPCTYSFHKWPHGPVEGQGEIRSQKLHPGLPGLPYGYNCPGKEVALPGTLAVGWIGSGIAGFT